MLHALHGFTWDPKNKTQCQFKGVICFGLKRYPVFYVRISLDDGSWTVDIHSTQKVNCVLVWVKIFSISFYPCTE